MNQKLIEAIKNPPPERLAKIEYQSHALQAIGIIIVCVMLIVKGFWYIIFALIFGVGISYSQGMTAYSKYKAIKSIVGEEPIEDYEKDISPSRRRAKIIKYALGPWATLGSSILAVIGTILIVDPSYNRWLLMFLYPLSMMVLFIGFYFFVCYWISCPFYRRRIKK